VKTIKQIADEIGVSKTAVRKKIPPEVRAKFAQTGNHVIWISSEDEKLIKSAFSDRKQGEEFAVVSGEVSANQFPQVSGEVSAAFVLLQEQLQVKDRQIEDLTKSNTDQQQSIRELTAALENTTASLQAAQALHAGTMQNQLTDGEVAYKDEGKSKGFWERLFSRKRNGE